MLTLNPLTDTFWASIGNDIPILLIGYIPILVTILRRMEKHHKEHLELLKKHHEEAMKK